MLVLIVLSACAIISDQLLLPDYGRRALFWIPYLLPSPHINHYHPVHYGYPKHAVVQDDPSLPELLEQPKNLFGGVESRNNHKIYDGIDGTLGDEYTDIQLRMDKPEARLFPFASTFDNPFWKTATFTITSTVNVTSVISCIPAAQFSAGSSTVACRRKRHGDSLDIAEDTQFEIHPSKMLPMVTSLVTTDLLDDSQRIDHRSVITSSKNDLTDNNNINGRQHRSFKEMRLQLKNVASVNVYSYVFNSFVSTKSVTLVANANRLICLPGGLIVC